MEFYSLLGLLLGSSWASGINLYLTIAALGLAHRFEWIVLPGTMDVFASPIVIAVALILYCIEFVADKVPYVDSAWDSVHTFIRPFGGALIGYLALNGADPVLQTSVALVTGTIALDAHLTKATARAAINASPEPVSNIVASTTEDASVLGAIFLLIHNPIIIAVLVICFIVFSVWFIKKMFRFFKKILKPKKIKEKNER